MKFYTNKISTGKQANFSEFVTKLANSNASVKTASAAAVTKEANIANFGDKKANPFGAKDKEDKKGEEPAKKEEEKEACGTACASTEKEVKVAGDDRKPDKDGEVHVEMQEMDPVGGTNTGKPEGEKKKESEAKAEVKEAAKKAAPAVKTAPAATKTPAKVPAKKASNDEVPAENKGVTHKVDECCGAPSSKGDDGSEGNKKSAPKTEAKEEKKEASTRKYVKIANLDAKTKADWKKYWKNLYPSEYVEAMFADK